MVTIILSVRGWIDFTVYGIWPATSFWKYLKDHVTIIWKLIWWPTPSSQTQSVVLAWLYLLCQTRSLPCADAKPITNNVHSFFRIHKLVHLDNDFTGPTVKAVLTMLAGSHTRLSAQAPFPKFHPDAACTVILLKCKPQIQLCLLWLCRPSVNTQCCHNVAITARGNISTIYLVSCNCITRWSNTYVCWNDN